MSKSDRQITQAASGRPCIACSAPHSWACHYNGPRQHLYGKGRSKKGHVLTTAEFCKSCDQVFTEGSYSPEDHPVHPGWRDIWDRSEQFLHWIMLTNIRRREAGDL